MLVGLEGMGQPEPKRPRLTRWIALLAVLRLVAGVALALRSRHGVGTPAPAPTLATDDAEATPEGEAPSAEPRIPDDETHRKALAGDKEKSKWVDEIPGLDVADLSARQLDVFLASANTQRCTCGCGYTLAGCRVYDSTCEKSGPRVAALLDSVRAGQVRDATGLRKRPAHRG